MSCNDKKFNLKSTPNLSKTNFIEEIVAQCFPSYKMITNRDSLNDNESSINSTTPSSSGYSILRCYEIFYIQIKSSNQKVYGLDKVSNEEKFQLGNQFLNLDLIQARRLGKKIAQTNSFLTKK
jgi:hypothetical protein